MLVEYLKLRKLKLEENVRISIKGSSRTILGGELSQNWKLKIKRERNYNGNISVKDKYNTFRSFRFPFPIHFSIFERFRRGYVQLKRCYDDEAN